MPQTEEQKIRSRLRSYERKLQQEKEKYGWYDDGAGKRYQVGPHYMLLDDNEGATLDRTLPLSNAAEAHRLVASNAITGSVALLPWAA